MQSLNKLLRILYATKFGCTHLYCGRDARAPEYTQMGKLFKTRSLA